jgi:uncharacterized damage-inducible protein DinB
MVEYVRAVLTGQFEAALCMLSDCVRKCPEEHWEGKIANDSFRQVAYHTLFYVDYYLSANEQEFQLRDFHHRGGDERTSDEPSAGLTKAETLRYIAVCRQKLLDVLAKESAEALQSESGFSRLALSRGELHIYNIRHVQHHTGQLSAYLRRIVEDGERWWVKSGWRA